MNPSIVKLMAKLNKYQHRLQFGGASDSNIYAQKVEQYKRELTNAGVNIPQTGGALDFGALFTKMNADLKEQVTVITNAIGALNTGVDANEIAGLKTKIAELKKQIGDKSMLENLVKNAFEAHVNAKKELLNIQQAINAKAAVEGKNDKLAELNKEFELPVESESIDDITMKVMANAEVEGWIGVNEGGKSASYGATLKLATDAGVDVEKFKQKVAQIAASKGVTVPAI